MKGVVEEAEGETLTEGEVVEEHLRCMAEIQ